MGLKFFNVIIQMCQTYAAVIRLASQQLAQIESQPDFVVTHVTLSGY